jgi:hypothetical protein
VRPALIQGQGDGVEHSTGPEGVVPTALVPVEGVGGDRLHGQRCHVRLEANVAVDELEKEVMGAGFQGLSAASLPHHIHGSSRALKAPTSLTPYNRQKAKKEKTKGK